MSYFTKIISAYQVFDEHLATNKFQGVSYIGYEGTHACVLKVGVLPDITLPINTYFKLYIIDRLTHWLYYSIHGVHNILCDEKHDPPSCKRPYVYNKASRH